MDEEKELIGFALTGQGLVRVYRHPKLFRLKAGELYDLANRLEVEAKSARREARKAEVD